VAAGRKAAAKANQHPRTKWGRRLGDNAASAVPYRRAASRASQHEPEARSKAAATPQQKRGPSPSARTALQGLKIACNAAGGHGSALAGSPASKRTAPRQQ
jgi:hypothetical protein